MVKETQNKPPRSELEEFLLFNGINQALILKMSYEEVLDACNMETYSEFNRYMVYMAHKYSD